MTHATPTKLRNGSWGATVTGTVRVGDNIQITTRAGKSWTATVSTIVWSGGGKSIVATQSTDRAASAPARGGSYGGPRRGGAREGGLEKMTALMTAHPDIQGVFTINEPSALGAEQAARQAGRDNFVIVSVDGSLRAGAEACLGSRRRCDGGG